MSVNCSLKKKKREHPVPAQYALALLKRIYTLDQLLDTFLTLALCVSKQISCQNYYK